MRLTSPSRRAAGLLAVTTIGLSTAVLSVTGVASAAPVPITSDSPEYGANSDHASSVTIPGGYCSAFVVLIGGEGGGVWPGSSGGDVEFEMPVTHGQVFTFSAGAEGDVGAGTGGGATRLLLGDHVVAVAAGGAGTNAAGEGVNDIDPAFVVEDSDPSMGTSADGFGREGDGLIDVYARGCDAPYDLAIDGISGGDGSATVTFYPEDGDTYAAAPDGYEYTVDGGASYATATTSGTGDDGELQFTVPGLTNGTEYSVQLRATSEFNGTSEWSDPKTVTPYVPVGAPGNVSVVTGANSLKVSWSAAAATGTFPVGDYEVYLSDVDAQSGGGAGCTTATLGCVIPVEAGHAYTVSVLSTDSRGYAGGSSAAITTGAVPGVTAPTSVPTGSGTVSTGGSTTLTAGKSVTLAGAGFLPGSTVQFFVYSTPQALGSAVAADGSFSGSVTLPAGLTNGTHHLVAAGVDPNGNAYYLVTEITVTGGTPALAYTGFSPAPYLGVGLVALLAGAGLVVAGRRRNA